MNGSKRSCLVSGCTKVIHSKNYCSLHFNQYFIQNNKTLPLKKNQGEGINPSGPLATTNANVSNTSSSSPINFFISAFHIEIEPSDFVAYHCSTRINEFYEFVCFRRWNHFWIFHTDYVVPSGIKMMGGLRRASTFSLKSKSVIAIQRKTILQNYIRELISLVSKNENHILLPYLSKFLSVPFNSFKQAISAMNNNNNHDDNSNNNNAISLNINEEELTKKFHKKVNSLTFSSSSLSIIGKLANLLTNDIDNNTNNTPDTPQNIILPFLHDEPLFPPIHVIGLHNPDELNEDHYSEDYTRPIKDSIPTLSASPPITSGSTLLTSTNLSDHSLDNDHKTHIIKKPPAPARTSSTDFYPTEGESINQHDYSHDTVYTKNNNNSEASATNNIPTKNNNNKLSGVKVYFSVPSYRVILASSPSNRYKQEATYLFALEVAVANSTHTNNPTNNPINIHTTHLLSPPLNNNINNTTQNNSIPSTINPKPLLNGISPVPSLSRTYSVTPSYVITSYRTMKDILELAKELITMDESFRSFESALSSSHDATDQKNSIQIFFTKVLGDRRVVVRDKILQFLSIDKQIFS